MRTLSEYTTHDVVSEDRSAYAAHVELWQTELHPNGALECYFAAEIVRATWRIRQYAIFPSPDMSDQARAAWLRYRDQTNLGIRRNLEELRRLQSDRYLQAHLGILLPGLASLKLVLPGLKRTKQQSDAELQPKKPESADIQRSEAILHAQIQDEERRQLDEFRKNNSDPAPEPESTAPAQPSTKPAAPRNAPCPCKSGRKYKQCCGHWSKTPLPPAAGFNQDRAA